MKAASPFSCSVKTGLLYSVLGVTLMALPCGVAATTRTVTTLADSGPGSLRQLILDSGPGDTIDFAVTGTITLTSDELRIGRDLNIRGPSAKSLAISGNNANRVFQILGGTVAISALTVRDGRAAGANGSDATLTSPASSGELGEGGGISNSGSLTLSSCVVTGNSAVGGAGGQGYAVAEFGSGGGFGGQAAGGGIFNGRTLILVDCSVVDNTSTGGNGGLATRNTGNGGGAGSSFGGGIYNLGVLQLRDCTVSGNAANGGRGGDGAAGFGGAAGYGGDAFGGAVCSPGSLTSTDCTIAGNSATGGSGGFGGGITLAPGGDGGHGGDGSGGGIWTRNFTSANCTMAGNAAIAGAGGAGGAGQPQGQQGANGISAGSGLNAQTSTGGILNSILAGNIASTIGPDVAGSIRSQGHNLIGKMDDSFGWIESDLTGTIAAPLDPRLGPLQDNGGPTFTMALLPGSAAIDAGASGGTTTDQRGALRPNDNPAIRNASGGNGSDIGAYEAGPLMTGVTGGGTVCTSPDPRLLTYNSTATLTAIAASGWVFSHWSGDASGTNNPLSVTTARDTAITANFTSAIPDIILDDTAATFTGTWSTGTGNSCYGSDFRVASAYPSSGVASFIPNIAVAGNYDVYLWLPNVPNVTPIEVFTVAFDGGTNGYLRTALLSSPFGAWGRLPGTFKFAQGTVGSVSISGAWPVPNSGYGVYADAVRFVWSADQGPMPCLRIIFVGRTASVATVTWLSMPGRSYRVQYKPSLNANAWTDLSGDITASGDTVSKADDTLGNAAQRFYRVMLVR